MRDKKKGDRRTVRTTHSLSQAMVDLVQEKRFDDITVQNLIDRADVGRSTFYSHFRDKEDFFQRDWERFLDALVSQIEWDKAGSGSFIPVVYLFRHLQDFQPFYQGLVRSRKADAVFKSGTEYLTGKIEAALAARAWDNPSIPTPIMAGFLSNQLFALLKWWLDERMPYSPERMDEIFHELVTPTFRMNLPGD